MDWSVLAAGGAGVAVGFGVSVGVGPANALCLRQTLRAGWGAGITAGAGALVADTLYGTAAVYGLALAADWVGANANPLRMVAALVLIVIALYLIRTTPRMEADEENPRAKLAGFATCFAVTLSNPLAILTIAALLAALGASGLAERQPVAAIIGIALGCALWWGGITTLTARLRHSFSVRAMHRVHAAVGGLMLLLAIGLLLQAAGVF